MFRIKCTEQLIW